MTKTGFYFEFFCLLAELKCCCQYEVGIHHTWRSHSIANTSDGSDCNVSLSDTSTLDTNTMQLLLHNKDRFLAAVYEAEL